MRGAMAVEGCSGVYAGHKMRANVEQCGQDAFATSAESGGFAGASCRCRGECNVVWTGLQLLCWKAPDQAWRMAIVAVTDSCDYWKDSIHDCEKRLTYVRYRL